MLGFFAVMLRQASFFALVEYEKSTLPQQKIRLPCLTAKFLQHLRFKIARSLLLGVHTANRQPHPFRRSTRKSCGSGRGRSKGASRLLNVAKNTTERPGCQQLSSCLHPPSFPPGPQLTLGALYGLVHAYLIEYRALIPAAALCPRGHWQRQGPGAAWRPRPARG